MWLNHSQEDIDFIAKVLRLVRLGNQDFSRQSRVTDDAYTKMEISD